MNWQYLFNNYGVFFSQHPCQQTKSCLNIFLPSFSRQIKTKEFCFERDAKMQTTGERKKLVNLRREINGNGRNTNLRYRGERRKQLIELLF